MHLIDMPLSSEMFYFTLAISRKMKVKRLHRKWQRKWDTVFQKCGYNSEPSVPVSHTIPAFISIVLVGLLGKAL